MHKDSNKSAEEIEGPSAFTKMDGIGSLGSLPLIVDTAADEFGRAPPIHDIPAVVEATDPQVYIRQL